jgi:carboxyl-terminal processing protease
VKPFRTPLLAALIATVLGAASFVAGSRLAMSGPFDEVADTARELARRSAIPVSERELAQAAIRGMLEALDDPYAAYLDRRRSEQIDELVGGSIVGIGVWLKNHDRGLLVNEVLPDTPAARAGLRRGDVIVGVDEHDVRGLTVQEAARYLKGEKGSRVSLVVRRGGERLELSVARAEIEIDDVQSRMLSDGIGYARLYRFSGGAAEELRSRLRELLDRGASSIILDLRSNPGGLADEAVEVASIFLDGGVVARMRERGKPERVLEATGEPLARFPLVVLVDGGTASASELVAGALQDHDRARLVGTNTFGKGSVLTVSDLEGESKIQYTTAFFFTPDGHEIEGRGINPDVTVLPAAEDDAQLRRAIELLKG